MGWSLTHLGSSKAALFVMLSSSALPVYKCSMISDKDAVRGLKCVGTPFPGPPFLHCGVPRPQRAFSMGTHVPRAEGIWTEMFFDILLIVSHFLARMWRILLLKFSNVLVSLNLVKVTVWLEILPAAKLKRAHRFLQGEGRDFYRSHYLKITL